MFTWAITGARSAPSKITTASVRQWAGAAKMFLQPTISVVERSSTWLIVCQEECSLIVLASDRSAGCKQQLVVINTMNFFWFWDIVWTFTNLQVGIVLVRPEVLCEVFIFSSFINFRFKFVSWGLGWWRPRCGGVIRVIFNVFLSFDSFILHLNRKCWW